MNLLTTVLAYIDTLKADVELTKVYTIAEKYAGRLVAANIAVIGGNSNIEGELFEEIYNAENAEFWEVNEALHLVFDAIGHDVAVFALKEDVKPKTPFVYHGPLGRNLATMNYLEDRCTPL